ncbi:MAG TPA: hypothetical protein VJB63_02055 [Patescibacteria group bacterium]|nr:hypothetical protein [Patescibacteria group bacterium]
MSKEQLNQKLGNERLKQKPIADPLEGIIEGNNRQERYTRFINEIIAKIWSPDRQSGRWGEYNDDLFRSTRFSQGDIHGYTQSSPFGIDPQFISNEQFEKAIAHLDTPDYVRVRSIPPQIYNQDITCVPAGGSCVIETYGMRIINEIQKGINDKKISSEYLTDFVRSSIDIAPTITHISGALLGGHTNAVHYIESDMWTEKITEYGVPQEEAHRIVNDAYERIHDAVARRTRLINPEATLIKVNFDELYLTQAIHKWFDSFGMLFDPRYRVAEVIYTYDGPKQLDLLKNALHKQLENRQLGEREKSAIENILHSSYHMRVKQIDHLRWGSMKLPKEFIVGQRPLTPEEQEKYEKDYAYRMGIHIMKAVYEAHKNKNSTSIAVGFADMPSFHNEVQHESRTHINTPARLHRHNIDGHLEFLRSYTVNNGDERQKLLKEMNGLQNQILPFTIALKASKKTLDTIGKKLSQYDNTIKKNQKIIDGLEIMLSSPSMEIADTEKALASHKRELLQAQTDQIRQHKMMKDAEYQKALDAYNDAQNNCDAYAEIQTRINQTKMRLSEINGPNCFPLNDNPFIHHAMQFLWDHDFVVFMKDAVKIQSEYEKKTIQKDEASYQLKTLMIKIYPKLESYIHYLYGIVEYPYVMRNNKVMS